MGYSVTTHLDNDRGSVDHEKAFYSTREAAMRWARIEVRVEHVRHVIVTDMDNENVIHSERGHFFTGEEK